MNQRNGYPDGQLETRLGTMGMSKSRVSKLCAELDSRVQKFLGRELKGRWPYGWLDATYPKSREDGQVISEPLVVAVEVNTEGRTEVLGLPRFRGHAGIR